MLLGLKDVQIYIDDSGGYGRPVIHFLWITCVGIDGAIFIVGDFFREL